LRILLALLPAAVCAAAMFVCLRMMRHADMPADPRADNDELETLRAEVVGLREELARAPSVPADATPVGATSATGHPDG
jgi:hypothetical protein